MDPLGVIAMEQMIDLYRNQITSVRLIDHNF